MKKLTTILILATLLFGQDEIGEPFVNIEQDTVQFGINDMYRNCGALFDMNIEQEENIFTVTAIDTGGLSYCQCWFDVEMDVTGISAGDYIAYFYSYDIDPGNGLDTLYIGEVSFTVEEDGGLFSVLSAAQSPCGGFQTTTLIHVPGDYPTIQDGIDAATEGDTVLVAMGAYEENIIWPERDGIKLIGAGGGLCSINGGENGTVISIDMDTTGIITRSTLIRGFTIRRGNGYDQLYGGGIRCVKSDPELTDMYIMLNTSERGGGLYIQGGSPLLHDVEILSNDATYGGGIFIENSQASFNNIELSFNLADYGGGIYISENTEIELRRVLIMFNEVGVNGGGIYNDHLTSHYLLINSTVGGNNAGQYAGGIYTSLNPPQIFNSIIWNNLYYDEEIYSLIIAYSDIYGGEDGIEIDNSDNLEWLEGNIDEDPNFVDMSSWDYSLRHDSPCIDAGTAFFVWEGDTLLNMTEDEYIGDAPDMGALEYDGFNSTEPNDYIPTNYMLKPAYPNPFNPTTTISYDIPQESHVILTVYDLMGRELETLVNAVQPIGNHQITWNASNYSSGVYLVQLISEEYRSVQKLMLIK